MKQIWFFALVMISMLVLVGCVAPASPPGPVAPANTEAESEVATESTEPVTIRITLELGSSSEQRKELLDGLFQEYMEQHPNVTVKFEPFIGDYDEYITKLLVDLKGGVGPDIFSTTGSTLLKFAETGTLVAASSGVEAYVKGEALNDAVVNSVTGRDGKIYGMPWKGDWPALFYNVNMYQEAGISKPPANWDELVETAQALTKFDDDGNLVVAGFFVRKAGGKLGIFEKWYPFFTAAGGKLFNEGMTEATFNSPEGVEALQFYVDLMHKYNVDSFELPQGDTNGFISGNVAQYLREPGNIARFQDTAPDLNFGTAVIPSYKAPAKGIANIDAVVVTKASKNPAVAWDLLMWLSSPEIATRRDKALFRQPLLKSVAADPFFQENEWVQPFLEQDADVFPFHPNSYEIESVIGSYVERALHQDMTPQEALDAAAQEVNALLKEE